MLWFLKPLWAPHLSFWALDCFNLVTRPAKSHMSPGDWRGTFQEILIASHQRPHCLCTHSGVTGNLGSPESLVGADFTPRSPPPREVGTTSQLSTN